MKNFSSKSDFKKCIAITIVFKNPSRIDQTWFKFFIWIPIAKKITG
jgi:hypothetical protein